MSCSPSPRGGYRSGQLGKARAERNDRETHGELADPEVARDTHRAPDEHPGANQQKDQAQRERRNRFGVGQGVGNLVVLEATGGRLRMFCLLLAALHADPSDQNEHPGEQDDALYPAELSIPEEHPPDRHAQKQNRNLADEQPGVNGERRNQGGGAKDQCHVGDVRADGVPDTHLAAAGGRRHAGDQHLRRRCAERDDGEPDDEAANPEIAGQPGRAIHETIGSPDHGDETHDDRGNGVEQRQGDLSGETRNGPVLLRTEARKPSADPAGKTTPRSAIRVTPREGTGWVSAYGTRSRSLQGQAAESARPSRRRWPKRAPRSFSSRERWKDCRPWPTRSGANGGDATPIACHAGDPEQRRAMLDQALTAYGKVDILVNNAATNPHFGPMLSVDERAWDKTFEVNVKGYFGMIQLVANHLQQRRAKGSIVNIASVAGYDGGADAGGLRNDQSGGDLDDEDAGHGARRSGHPGQRDRARTD